MCSSDLNLQTQINNANSARAIVDANLQSQIINANNARAAGDANLQSQINNIWSYLGF